MKFRIVKEKLHMEIETYVVEAKTKKEAENKLFLSDAEYNCQTDNIGKTYNGILIENFEPTFNVGGKLIIKKVVEE